MYTLIIYRARWKVKKEKRRKYETKYVGGLNINNLLCS